MAEDFLLGAYDPTYYSTQADLLRNNNNNANQTPEELALQAEQDFSELLASLTETSEQTDNNDTLLGSSLTSFVEGLSPGKQAETNADLSIDRLTAAITAGDHSPDTIQKLLLAYELQRVSILSSLVNYTYEEDDDDEGSFASLLTSLDNINIS